MCILQCIISHTVDYVQELQDKVDAYKTWCRCSPPLPDAPPLSQTHDQAHGEDFASMSKMEVSSSCKDCATLSRGKRHWGSNHPQRLKRDDSKEKVEGMRSRPQRSTLATTVSTEASKSQNICNLVDCCPCDEHSSDLELDEWKQSGTHYTSHLYDTSLATVPSRKRKVKTLSANATSIYHPCSHDRSCARLGLLAQVSAETQRVDEDSSAISQM
jgi:hypothetical protein